MIAAPANGAQALINIITAENRHLFHHALTEMHVQRKHLFVDRMRWQMESVGGLEIDNFDSGEAIYLIETSTPVTDATTARNAVVQSARLLRSDRPHLLGDVFPQLCSGPVTRSPKIWEATRFCPAPETPKGEARRMLLFRMIGGILETGLLFGIEQVTFVASAALRPLALRAGWELEALGPEVRIGRERLIAMIAHVSSAGLARVRANHGLASPLTRYADAELRRAA
jgi:N-acyl-L-homoserine lactone synthetase